MTICNTGQILSDGKVTAKLVLKANGERCVLIRIHLLTVCPSVLLIMLQISKLHAMLIGYFT